MLRVIFLCFFILVYNLAEAQSRRERRVDWVAPEYKWGIGLRLGSPLGISLKRYTWNNKAFELNFGRPLFWFYDREELFQHRFYDKDYAYRTTTAPLSLQLRMMKFKPWSEDQENLRFYYGGGIQARRFVFRYYDHFLLEHGRHTYFGLGPEVIGGIEYKVGKYPVVLFMDAGIYMEIVDRPFSFEPTLGLGMRYLWGFWYEREAKK
ncbi:MAG: hypothetical protein ACK4ND_15830 [Cytophagaceae bacterium]